jgi:beta-barrel assembly-enhancing protease
MKTKFIVLCFLGVFFWAIPSHSFNFGNILKEVEKSTRPPEKIQSSNKETKSTQQSPGQSSGQSEGLIGLGNSLGIFDKKTSKILKQSVNTLKALQPIAYEEEKVIGGRLAVEVFNRYGGAYDDAGLLRYVNLVGQAVADVSSRSDIDYHFSILNTEFPNAFATPGGYVFVSIGLLRILENESELAGVLAHEVAHIARKHALQTIERSRSLQGVSSLTLTVIEKDPGLFDKLIDEVSNVLFTKGLDKNLEFEADKYGREFAYRTGYYPGALERFIQKLGTSKKNQGSIFSSTHPTSRERYNLLQKSASRYKKASLYPTLRNRYKLAIKRQN